MHPIQNNPFSPPIASLPPERCESAGFIGNVVAPWVEDTLPPAETIKGRIFEHLSGTRGLMNTLTSDLCEAGRISENSARALTSFVTRSSTSIAVTAATLKIAPLSLAVGGPVGLATTLGAGVLGLRYLPPLVDSTAQSVFDASLALLERARSWLGR